MDYLHIVGNPCLIFTYWIFSAVLHRPYVSSSKRIGKWLSSFKRGKLKQLLSWHIYKVSHYRSILFSLNKRCFPKITVPPVQIDLHEIEESNHNKVREVSNT